MSDEHLERIFETMRDRTATHPAQIRRVLDRLGTGHPARTRSNVWKSIRPWLISGPVAAAVRLPLAVAITGALFLLMHRLIDGVNAGVERFRPVEEVGIVRAAREPASHDDKRVLPEKPPWRQPADFPEMIVQPSVAPEGAVTTRTGPKIEIEPTELHLRRTGLVDTEATPIVRVEPIYPRIALEKRLEGWVLVQFDVESTGDVVNPRVLSAEPARIFDRAVLNAVKKWKYGPPTRNGEPTKISGFTVRVAFRLENAG